MFPTAAVIDRLQADLARDLLAFLPELILCGAVVLLLLLRLFSSLSRVHLGWLGLVAAAAAFAVAAAQWAGVPALTPELPGGLAFSGLLALDSFANFVRVFLLAFLTLVVWLTLLTGIPDAEDSADFVTLLLGSTVGMMLMVSANHLLMVFMAVEMASVPSYALAGFLKGRRRGSEAALKYVIYGASASGVMLYGISLLVAQYGSGYLPQLRGLFDWAEATGADPLLGWVGVLFVAAGLGFKLAAVPFHFWCPDVFEGAAAEVAAFLSVASKGAAIALTTRFLQTVAGADAYSGVMAGGTLGLVLILGSAATATLGNLAALGQTNLKRLLAYSTIAHAGYMLMGLAALVRAEPIGSVPRFPPVAAVLFYLVAYLFMNLGAFAVVALIRNRTGSEDLNDWRGLVHREPVLVVALAVFLLSLLGIPPLAGFAAKFQVFGALYDSGSSYLDPALQTPGKGFPLLGYAFFALLAVAAINTVISAGYYLKVLRVMILDAPPAGEPEPPPAKPAFGAGLYATLLAAAVVAVGLFWDPLTRAANRAADSLKNPSAAQVAAPLAGRTR